MRRSIRFGVVAAVAVYLPVAVANTVKITPLGSHDGEFCRFDRAMLLEDPEIEGDPLVAARAEGAATRRSEGWLCPWDRERRPARIRGGSSGSQR